MDLYEIQSYNICIIKTKSNRPNYSNAVRKNKENVSVNLPPLRNTNIKFVQYLIKPSALSKSNLILRIRLKRTAERRNINPKARVQQEIGKLQGLTSPSGVGGRSKPRWKKTIVYIYTYIYINPFVSYGAARRSY